MFTGIIEEVGEIKSIQKGAKSARLTIKGVVVTKNSHIGDSIAVNGVCLTATTIEGDLFTADVMAELDVDALAGAFNLEKADFLSRVMLFGIDQGTT